LWGLLFAAIPIAIGVFMIRRSSRRVRELKEIEKRREEERR
jgi:hypothetical protein